jgi:hypothetical protein
MADEDKVKDKGSPVDKAAKLLAIFMVVILALALLNSAGDYIAAQIPPITGTIGEILHELGTAFHRIVQHGYQR